MTVSCSLKQNVMEHLAGPQDAQCIFATQQWGLGLPSASQQHIKKIYGVSSPSHLDGSEPRFHVQYVETNLLTNVVN